MSGVFQLHRNVREGAVNTEPARIANELEQCTGERLHLRVDPDGEHYTVEVPSRHTVAQLRLPLAVATTLRPYGRSVIASAPWRRYSPSRRAQRACHGRVCNPAAQRLRALRRPRRDHARERGAPRRPRGRRTRATSRWRIRIRQGRRRRVSDAPGAGRRSADRDDDRQPGHRARRGNRRRAVAVRSVCRAARAPASCRIAASPCGNVAPAAVRSSARFSPAPATACWSRSMPATGKLRQDLPTAVSSI